MRILLVIDRFLPDVKFGSELYTYYLGKGLTHTGHQVHFLHTDRGDERKVEERVLEGMPCTVAFRSPTYHGHGNFFGGDIDHINTIFCNVLARFRPDIVHINHLKRLSPDIPRLARERGIPVVFTLHDFWLICDRGDLRCGAMICDGPSPGKCADCNRNRYARWANWNVLSQGVMHQFKKIIKNALYQTCEHATATDAFSQRHHWVNSVFTYTSLFIAPSRFLLNVMRQNGLPADKSMYLDYGMDTSLFEHKVPQRPRACVRFGYVGSMSEHKGVHALLQAFDTFYDGELYIYGRENQQLFERFQHVLRQNNVHYKGYLLEENKAAAFAELDALIVPSVWNENSPLVIHEAFMAGIPVVTSNIGGMAELVPDRVCGLQFEVGNPLELRAKLIQLCSYPEQLDKLRNGIPKVISIADHLTELIQLYHHVQLNTVSSSLLPTPWS